MQQDERSTLREITEVVIIALIIALFVRTFLFETFVVEGYSMLDTLNHHERVLVNKFLYHLRPPETGEIIVFQSPADPRKDFVKRVAATSGEIIQMDDGNIFINGKRVDEDYITRGDDSDMPPKKVPPRTVFVLGDNRSNSDDSRNFGFVPEEHIRGKVILVFWPPMHIRLESEPHGVHWPENDS